jgi:hypothetical protein
MENPGRDIEYQKIVSIDGIEYKIHLLSPSRAIGLSVRLSKLIGEPLAAMAGAGEDPAKALPNAVRSLIMRMEEGEVVSLLQSLIATVTLQNKALSFDLHFHGRIGHLLKLAIKVVEVQLGDFTASLGEIMSEAMTKL